MIVYVIIGLAAVTPVIGWAILRWARPYRMRLAKEGAKLLSSPALSERQKVLVSDMLDDAFEWRFMVFAIVYMPILAIRSLIDPSYEKSVQRQDPEIAGFFELVATKKFQQLHMISVVAANPLCTILMLLELILIVLPLSVFGGGVKLAIKKIIDSTTAEITPKVGRLFEGA